MGKPNCQSEEEEETHIDPPFWLKNEARKNMKQLHKNWKKLILQNEQNYRIRTCFHTWSSITRSFWPIRKLPFVVFHAFYRMISSPNQITSQLSDQSGIHLKSRLKHWLYIKNVPCLTCSLVALGDINTNNQIRGLQTSMWKSRSNLSRERKSNKTPNRHK